jgi:flagellar basal-body rod protein FlgB
MLGFDNALGIHPTMMALRSRRAGVLAANLANADTPNYKARDLDFSSALGAAKSSANLSMTNRGHMSVGSADLMGAELLYRRPTQVSVDQNTVEVDVERAKFMDNSMRFQASLRFLDGKFSGLRSAFRGE